MEQVPEGADEQVLPQGSVPHDLPRELRQYQRMSTAAAVHTNLSYRAHT
jgi:hypothetical protein